MAFLLSQIIIAEIEVKHAELKANEGEIGEWQKYFGSLEIDRQKLTDIEGIETQDISDHAKRLQDDWTDYLDLRQVCE